MHLRSHRRDYTEREGREARNARRKKENDKTRERRQQERVRAQEHRAHVNRLKAEAGAGEKRRRSQVLTPEQIEACKERLLAYPVNFPYHSDKYRRVLIETRAEWWAMVERVLSPAYVHTGAPDREMSGHEARTHRMIVQPDILFGPSSRNHPLTYVFLTHEDIAKKVADASERQRKRRHKSGGKVYQRGLDAKLIRLRQALNAVEGTDTGESRAEMRKAANAVSQYLTKNKTPSSDAS